MNPNAEAIFKEFPFLPELFSKGIRLIGISYGPRTCVMDGNPPFVIHKAMVKRTDISIMSRVIRYPYPSTYFERILLLDRAGDLLAIVGCAKFEGRLFLSFLRQKARFSYRWLSDFSTETVWNAIRRNGVTDKVYFVVSHYDNELTLYKPPKNFTNMASWLEEQKKLAEKKVKQAERRSTRRV